MAPKKAKTAAPNLPVPQSDDEAAAAIAGVGELQRAIDRLRSEADDKLALIAMALAAATEPLKNQHAAAVEGLRIYCEAHRARLTCGGKTKTAKFATGEIAWRARPAKVTLRGKVEDIVARLLALGMNRFVRVKREIDKEAMQREPDVARAVDGVSIGSAGEDFVVEPLELENAPSRLAHSRADCAGLPASLDSLPRSRGRVGEGGER